MNSNLERRRIFFFLIFFRITDIPPPPRSIPSSYSTSCLPKTVRDILASYPSSANIWSSRDIFTAKITRTYTCVFRFFFCTLRYIYILYLLTYRRAAVVGGKYKSIRDIYFPRKSCIYRTTNRASWSERFRDRSFVVRPTFASAEKVARAKSNDQGHVTATTMTRIRESFYTSIILVYRTSPACTYYLTRWRN